MGFRYRKSVKSGPFRVNLSKSGVGYSVGVKGFRFTKKASGGTRTTTSIPGTGISYVKDSKKQSRNTAKQRSAGISNALNFSAGTISQKGKSSRGPIMTILIWLGVWFASLIVVALVGMTIYPDGTPGTLYSLAVLIVPVVVASKVAFPKKAKISPCVANETMRVGVTVPICEEPEWSEGNPSTSYPEEDAQRQEAQEQSQAGQRREGAIPRAGSEQVTPEQKTPEECEHRKDKGYKINTYRVAGTSFRSDAIASLGEENDDYGASKRDLVDEDMIDEEIYQLRFHPQKVELVPEPDNKYDSNAVKVIVDGVHVGYIKKGSCTHVKKLLAEDRILNINCKIGGGKFKIITEDYDPEKDKDVYTLERDEREYWVELKIKESTKE